MGVRLIRRIPGRRVVPDALTVSSLLPGEVDAVTSAPVYDPDTFELLAETTIDRSLIATPAAPVLSALSSTSIRLTLPTTTTVGHQRYEIHFSFDDVNYGPETLSATASTYTVSGLTEGTLYYYALRDVDIFGNRSQQGPSTSRETLPAGVPAVVDKVDETGASAGVGPSDSPSGVFYGRTDLLEGDTWAVVDITLGLSVTPLEGGDFTWEGSGSFDWELRRSGAVFDTGTYTIV